MGAADRIGTPLHGSPNGVQRVERPADLRAARQLVIDVAVASGLATQRCANLALAVSEVVTNAIHHGNGTATIFAYSAQRTVVVDVHDHAAAEIPAFLPDLPGATVIHGRGLWLAQQLCDGFETRRHGTGNIVRLVMNL
jgi:anti-sigma regulatory factor (Ser/Thr protein kinase)